MRLFSAAEVKDGIGPRIRKKKKIAKDRQDVTVILGLVHT